MEDYQEDEEKLISVGTTEASPSSPVQVVYESAGANAAHPLSPGFEFHTGNATEAADTGIACKRWKSDRQLFRPYLGSSVWRAIDVYPPSLRIELRPENATDPIDTGIVTSPTRNSMLLADSHNPEDCQPLPLHPNACKRWKSDRQLFRPYLGSSVWRAIDVHPPSLRIEFHPENAIDPIDTGIVRSPTRTSMLLSDSYNPHDSQAFPLPPRGRSRTEPVKSSLMSTNRSVTETAGLDYSDYHDPAELEAASQPIPIEHVLEHSDFMPFASPTSATLELIPAQHELDDQRLEGLLFRHFHGEEQWLKEAREVLWESDTVLQEKNPIENVALCLKSVVWDKYKVEKEPPGRRDLLWVMDPFLPKKKNANPTAFNTFSFRALFGAVLHDDEVASERAAQNAPERAAQNASERGAQNASERGAQNASERGAQNASERGAQNASERGAQNASERGAQRPAEKTVKKAMDQSVQGMFPIHVAAEKLYPDAVLYLLKWGVKVDQQSLSTRKTALHYAVRFPQHKKKQKRQKAVLDVLNAFKARHNVNDAKGHVPLFHAIVNEDIDLVKLLIKDAPIDHKDEDGDTHLHIAVDINSKEIIQLLIMNGANPTLCNHDGLTPSHIAAQKANSYLEEMNEESKRAGIDLVCTFLQEDTSGNTPLDYAAIHSHESTFWYMWECIEECPSRNIASYKPVLERIFGRCTENIRLATLQQTLEMLPKPMVQLLLTEDSDTSTHDYGDDDNSDHTLERLSTQSQQPVSQRDPHQQQPSFYNLLKCEDDACIPVVNTVLDKCLYGDKVVVSKVLDSGRNGEYPAKSNHDAVLRKFVSSHYAIWGHPTMTIWINGKWNQFGKIIVLVFALLYCLQMLALTTALCLAARPGVTDEVLNYYNTPLDGFRGFVEGVVMVMLVVKIANELQKIVILRPMLYIRDLFVLVNIAAISLLVITIILRAAQSNIQWVFAALAYLMYTMLALEYLSLIYWSSTYIHTLFIIVKQDITKFLAVFLVYLVGFAGAFLLVLQVDRANPAAVQEAGGMASASGGDGADNSTVYVWNTFYLGFRLLVESRSVLNYNGNLGWLAVLFYFAFLLVTVFIMLKVLIAQMLDTYVTVRSNAGALATYHRARFLLRYLSCYEYWRKLRSTRNQTENDEHTWTKDAIIWDGKQCVCRGNAAGCCCDAFRFMKKFAKYLFPGDRIAVRVQSTDSKQEAMTVHNMQRMMEKLKTTIKTDLKEVRRGIRAVQAGRVPGYN